MNQSPILTPVPGLSSEARNTLSGLIPSQRAVWDSRMLDPAKALKICRLLAKARSDADFGEMRSDQSLEIMFFLRMLLEQAWCPETSVLGREEWDKDRPFAGQSDVTALVIQLMMGGEIVCRGHSARRYSNQLVARLHWDFCVPNARSVIGTRLAQPHEVMRPRDLLENPDAAVLRLPQRYAKLRERLSMAAASVTGEVYGVMLDSSRSPQQNTA